MPEPAPHSNPLRDLLQTAADQIASAAESAERIYRNSFVSTDQLTGLYRGTIASADDPSGRRRVQVTVPEAGDVAGWAELAQPLDGDPVVPPSVGSTVWVMFERGDRAAPVVIGIAPV
jgi:hypothetical protein